MVKITRENPGVYHVEGTDLWILRTEHDGPNGGTYILWEAALDEGAELVIGGGETTCIWPAYTLKEAKENVKAFLLMKRASENDELPTDFCDNCGKEFEEEDLYFRTTGERFEIRCEECMKEERHD